MARAIELSRQSFSAPNPSVGCVIVRDNQIVGEGFTAPDGGPHAEAVALAKAGDQARGATCYVTLEPCNHVGRTPACSQALIQAGVAKVVIAHRDPNPTAAGGIESLQSAGVAVEVGDGAAESLDVLEPFLVSVQRGSPFVLLKAAITLDGYCAWSDGSSKWITGEVARHRARLMRAKMGAVMVGAGTILADDPQLTARDPLVTREPDRILWDRSGRLTGGERVFDGDGRVFWLVERATKLGQVEIPNWSIESVLEYLWQQQVRGILAEGGPTMWRRLLDAQKVDRICLFVAPKVFGSGIPWTSVGASWMPNGLTLDELSVEQVGQDILVTTRPKKS